jgi:restriction system protein
MWQREIRHPDLKTYRLIKGNDPHVVDQKAKAQMFAWEERWKKKSAADHARELKGDEATRRGGKKQEAEMRTQEAQAAITQIDNVLALGLGAARVDYWETLKDRSPFPTPPPKPPVLTHFPSAPAATDQKYQPTLTFLDRIFTSREQKKRTAANQRFSIDYEAWKKQKELYERSCNDLSHRFQAATEVWNREREEFLAAQACTNDSVERRKTDYLAGNPEAVEEYSDIVLGASPYPDEFPKECQIDYVAESKILVIDYTMPAPAAIPRLKEVRYIASRDTLTETFLPDSTFRKMYDELLYAITLRSIHELFAADLAAAVDSIVFNGWVRAVNSATGKEDTACVMSVQVRKAEFDEVNLGHVDPRACFKALKGVCASKLSELTPVRPILQLNKEDKRFITARAVADQLDGAFNLAAMDWEDFEQLIREIFEKEFSQNGGEVKITRASRDEGVDAVAFDPDPIRGGKIVIQAKRYTNTVGVSAVRDLYGTVMNEGANKGILVTTADYGPDAYAFCRDKPLTLLNGAELLYLLEKHGHRARIDLKEAKALAKDQEERERQH